MNDLRHVLLQPVLDSRGTQERQARLHLAVDLLQPFFLLEQILLGYLNLDVELLELFLIDDLHGEVERA